MNLRLIAVWALAIAVAAAGCTDRSLTATDGGGDSRGDGTTDQVSVDQREEGPPPFVVEGIELANGQRGPTDIAVDDAFVYWSTFEDDLVTKVPNTGASAPTVVHRTGFSERKSMAVDSTTVYWGGMHLFTQTKATGLIKEFSLGTFAAHLTAAAGRLFWMDEQTVDGIWSMLPDGTDARVIVVPQKSLYARLIFGTDGLNLFLGISDENDDAGVIEMVPATGGTPVPFATTRFLWTILADDEYVYWLEGRQIDGEIKKKLKNGTGDVITVLTAADVLDPQSMAMDATTLYWTQLGVGAGNGAVRKVRKSGGDPVLLAKNQVVPQGLAVDDAFVYWVNYGPTQNGTVRKIAK